MAVLEIQRVLKEKREFYQQKRHTIGSIIKHYRKKQMMTLEESAEGICSVSYLSKLENNLINPSEKFIIPLKNRFKIQEEECQSQEPDYIKVMFESFIKNKLSYTINDIRKLKEKADYQSKLVLFAYYVKANDLNSSNELYHDIIHYVVLFTEEETQFFLFLMVVNFYALEHYSEVVDLYHKVIQRYTKNLITRYIKTYYVLALFGQGNYLLAAKESEKTIADLLEVHAIEQIKQLQIRQLLVNNHQVDLNEVDETIDEMHTFTKDDISYFKGVLYFHKGQHEMSFMNFQSTLEKPEWVKTLQLINCDKLHKINLIKTFFEENDRKLGNKADKIVRNYLYYKYIEPDQMIEHIRNEVLNTMVFTENYIVLDYIYREAHQLFKNMYYYKEAGEVLEKHNRILRNLVRG